MSAVIIDTETTGFDQLDVIELAYAGPIASPRAASEDAIECACLFFRPSKPIQLGAMATHHIIAEDLVDCAPWPGTWELPVTCAGVEYLVGHNIDFDWKAIGSPSIRRICTVALSRHVWPDIDSHALGALIYHLLPAVTARDLVRGAHSAAADVGLCARVLFALTDALQPLDWHHLWELSEEARIPKRIHFGKYGPKDGRLGTLISDIRRMDPGYVSWLLRDCDQVRDDPYLRKALTR